MTDKLWGGRFTETGSDRVQAYGASIAADQYMIAEDIQASIAHAQMLGQQAIITAAEAAQIVAGLQAVRADFESGVATLQIAQEDVHMNVEVLLTEKIGPVAGKLHTARSRNDQVATDFHLWVANRLPNIIEAIKQFQKTLLQVATDNQATLMPGYTHLQHAQPVTFGFHLLAYVGMLTRDVERFEFNMQHAKVSPLGAAALAGTTFAIDRTMTADLLGFDDVYHNAMDAVSDRDFAIEFLQSAAILMMHLSRLSEELILWSSYEFGFVTLSDAYATGSSIMPQKKNADFAELTRGKTGRVYGDLMGLMTVMKGLPLAYNKDMQEDKQGVFETYTTIMDALFVFDGMFATLQVNRDVMSESTHNDFSNATELADYLANKGLAFREAHAIVGQLVLQGIQTQVNLQDMPLAELQKASELITDDVYQILQPMTAVERRTSVGGTAVTEVSNQIKFYQEQLGE
ncbi:argininosuccinate lyase [Weissella cibaria]|uniref:argininosuccinate lyase n=2 Tax=Weissella TaxID=46255 RepID=UPI0002191745|nr:argininosuccinate lyase [Weissella cibaria]APS26542.1 Argininosuccinate lyase 1 [Weissella cibaria]APU61939.1 Argininosuccinate lyase 1 [Weissella cibaria]APU64090.1 Argininosuccinate lyase 1 [Weissella cibaria]ASS52528.1 Argininosuccinate lyase [Weissella cibaria]MBA5962518.1 argininosuccinate lyase [Weissella cibaria]